MVFRDETMDYKGEFKIGVVAFWQGEIFDLKVVKLDESKSWKHRHLFSSVDWQAADQIDWYLRWTLTKDVIICMQDVNGEICMVNTKKNQGGWSISSRR